MLQALTKKLLDSGLVTRDALAAAAREQEVTGRSLGDILVKNGFVRHKDLVEAMLQAAPGMVQEERAFVPNIPAEALAATGTMIVAETETRLYAATLSSQAIAAQAIARHDPREIVFVPASLERVDAYLAEAERMAANTEESKLDRMIYEALAFGVSDVHIVPRRETYTVFFRYLGIRQIHHEGPMDEYHVITARIKDRARMDLSERRIPQDGGFQTEHRGRFVDLRVATIPAVHGEHVIIRVLDPESVNIRLPALGITRLEEWRKGVSRADGLCLVCGPTGSGKTTTLNATLRELDRFGRSIYTVEDPVEYHLPYIGQVTINPAVGLDFSRAIRAFMRADPNVIVLGEIRDEETSRNMARAAETGHLVLATLHTGSIRGAVQRLQDLGVDARELRYLLRCVLVQRLIRVYCAHCRGAGCPRCLGTGYGARTIVSECAYFHDEGTVSRMLDGERFWPSIVEDAVMKYRQGLTSKREIERVFGGEVQRLLEESDG